MQTNLKILVILSKLEMGGIEKTLLAGLPYFRKNNCEIHVFCIKGGTLEGDFINQGAKLHYFSRNNPFSKILDLRKVLKTQRFDVVHSRDGFTSGFQAMVSKSNDVPFIASLHSNAPFFKLDWKGKLFLTSIRSLYLWIHRKLISHYASKIIGHSEANLAYYKKQINASKKSCVIYNGIDFSRLDNENSKTDDSKKSACIDRFLEDAKITFIHIGSFRKQKNHNFLIDVFCNLDPRKNNYRLIVVGDGHLLPEIKEKVAKRGISDIVHFAGMDNDVGFFLDKSDVFIFPSLNEGFGNVLIEAQYKKLPVAASSISSHMESVFEGYHRYFFSPQNLEDATQKVKTLIIDIEKKEPQLETNKQDAFLFSKNFSIENMVNLLVRSYRLVNRNL